MPVVRDAGLEADGGAGLEAGIAAGADGHDAEVHVARRVGPVEADGEAEVALPRKLDVLPLRRDDPVACPLVRDLDSDGHGVVGHEPGHAAPRDSGDDEGVVDHDARDEERPRLHSRVAPGIRRVRARIRRRGPGQRAGDELRLARHLKRLAEAGVRRLPGTRRTDRDPAQRQHGERDDVDGPLAAHSCTWSRTVSTLSARLVGTPTAFRP